MARSAQQALVFRLKVTLESIRPPVWRRLLVRGDQTLAGLHQIIQTAMGWDDCHLHEFIIDRVSYGVVGGDLGTDAEDEAAVRIDEVVRGEGVTFRYVYDFGDCWRHKVEVEEVSPAEPGVSTPRCLAGKRACPPEDCGGPIGYGEILKILQIHQERGLVDQLDELPPGFDPAAFDLAQVNRRLGAG